MFAVNYHGGGGLYCWSLKNPCRSRSSDNDGASVARFKRQSPFLASVSALFHCMFCNHRGKCSPHRLQRKDGSWTATLNNIKQHVEGTRGQYCTLWQAQPFHCYPEIFDWQLLTSHPDAKLGDSISVRNEISLTQSFTRRVAQVRSTLHSGLGLMLPGAQQWMSKLAHWEHRHEKTYQNSDSYTYSLE